MAGLTSDTGGFRIDKVILARSGSANLVQNPSFKDGPDNWNFVNALVQASASAYEGNEVATIGGLGGALFQDVPITRATGRCFLLNFGYRATSTNGNLLVEVQWLDKSDSEIGLGLSLVIPNSDPDWEVYTGITEPAPSCTVKARVQFSHSSLGAEEAFAQIDKVLLGRLV